MSGNKLLLSRFLFLSLCLTSVVAIVTCTDAGLQPRDEEVPTYDNKLKITGEYCTSAYPYKDDPGKR